MTKKETITYWIKQHSNAVDKCSELQAKNERLIIQVETLSQENKRLREGTDCETESGGILCLELQFENERLKEAIELLLCHVAGCWCKTYGMEKGKCSRCQAELALKGE